jgi:hypothetical protein
MNDLDQRVQPVMLPLLSSLEPNELSPEDQRMLAAWAAKSTMVLDYVGPIVPRVFGPAAHRRMYEERLPPSGAMIFVAGSTETDPFLNDVIGSVSRELSLRTALPRALLVTIRIKHLMLHVFAPEHGAWTSGLTTRDDFIQIWPLTFQKLRWPPPKIFNSEFELVDVSKSAWTPFR